MIYITYIYTYKLKFDKFISYNIPVYIILFIGLPPWYTAFQHHKKLLVLPRQKTRFPNKNRGLPLGNHPSPQNSKCPA